MKIIKAIFAFIGILFGGMSGGQGKIGGKAPRRFGVPGIASIYAFFSGLGWRSLAFLLWIPILSLGYGVDSVLGAFLGHCEPLIRAVYGVLVSIPLLVFGIRKWAIAVVLLVIAYSIHAGSLGNISWFGDILVEDIVRFSMIGCLVIVYTAFDRK